MKEKLTQKDVEKIQQEIDHRKLVVRKEAIEAVKEARAQGDLSENFEYYAAKKHKNQNESRIRYLENMLKTATIVSDDSKDDEVGMDDIVEEYSAFHGINKKGIPLGTMVTDHVYVGGIASEYCIKETVFELLKAGHKVTLLVKGLGYVDYNGHLAAIDAMKKLGVEILE